MRGYFRGSLYFHSFENEVSKIVIITTKSNRENKQKKGNKYLGEGRVPRIGVHENTTAHVHKGTPKPSTMTTKQALKGPRVRVHTHLVRRCG